MRECGRLAAQHGGSDSVNAAHEERADGGKDWVRASQ